MSCNHPLPAFDTGELTENGKRLFIIGKYGDPIIPAWQVSKVLHKPFYHDLTDSIPIPCGHCVGCRMERAKNWSIRCCMEAKGKPCYFVTLTYDDYHLPVLCDGMAVLVKRHFQLFVKRLRKYSGVKFRYFGCGEYGEHTLRPHFHLLIFGDPFLDKLVVPGLPNHFGSDLLSRTWPFGFVDLSVAESGSIRYVAGYCQKKQANEYMRGSPFEPFILMSRRPGIGVCALSDVDLASAKVYGDFGNQHFSSIPRFFESRFADSELVAYKDSRIQLGKASAELEKCVFKTSDSFEIGDLKDRICEKKLQKVRLSKL